MINRSFVNLFADLKEIISLTGKITLPMHGFKNYNPGENFLWPSVYSLLWITAFGILKFRANVWCCLQKCRITCAKVIQ